MRKEHQLAILFADIAGSTRLYDTIGNTRAREVTSNCINLLSKITTDYQGRVIKTIGDEVMCTFPDSDTAANAAVRMQEEVQDQAESLGLRLRIRVGFHFGEVILENADVFGDAVNLAARMAAQAKADQIITTGETLETMSPHLRADSRVLITTTVKGKAQPIQICELTWGEEEELTIMGGVDTLVAPVADTPLHVSFRGKDVKISAKNSSVTMGRGKTNTFVVPDSMSSRVHARVEYRRGKAVLVDQSTNGTFVVDAQRGLRTFVHRDEHLLEGEGVLGLGREVSGSDPLAVHFVQ